jgi:lipopolysaccharide/colanic/teichoic acid biosynthesis glycosyltransferase
MRLSHVDELPQLINVIKGEMSLVGPRPERPEILDDLEQTYPNVRHRLTVKPGITGLAQIRDGYDTTVEGFRHKLRSDLEYIHNMSWKNELSILLKTFSKLHDSKAK